MTNRNAHKYTVKVFDMEGKRVYRIDVATLVETRKLAREFMREYSNVATVTVYDNTQVMDIRKFMRDTYVKLTQRSGLVIHDGETIEIKF